MKIGILTFHNAHNYGATLQAYALRTYLRGIGHDASIINYRNKMIDSAYKKVFVPRFFKRDILPTHWKRVWKECEKSLFGQKMWREQWEAFEQFIQEVILEGNTIEVIKEDLEKLDFDYFILGSDQIWTDELTGGLDQVYLGNFKTDAKIITYAASIADGEVPEKHVSEFKCTLQKMYALSVREEKLAKQLRNMLDREVSVTLDPTLLLRQEDYELFIATDSDRKERFVFAYFVVENPVLMECARHAAKLLKCQLIELHYFKTPEFGGEYQLANLGPREFLYYISHAEMVVTNSFHGTVFSILFKKAFYSVYKKNGRIENLLSFLNLEHRHIENKEAICPEDVIDYTDVENKLELYRTESIMFLKRALMDS